MKESEFVVCPLCMGSGCDRCYRGYVHKSEEDDLEWEKTGLSEDVCDE